MKTCTNPQSVQLTITDESSVVFGETYIIYSTEPGGERVHTINVEDSNYDSNLSPQEVLEALGICTPNGVVNTPVVEETSSSLVVENIQARAEQREQFSSDGAGILVAAALIIGGGAWLVDRMTNNEIVKFQQQQKRSPVVDMTQEKEIETTLITATPQIDRAMLIHEPSPFATQGHTRLSGGTYTRNPYQAVETDRNQNRNWIETGVETDRNSVETKIETGKNRQKPVETEIETEQPVSIETETVSNQNRNSGFNFGDVHDLLSEQLKSHLQTKHSSQEEGEDKATRYGLPKGEFEIDLKHRCASEEAKQRCFHLIDEGYGTLTKLMWGVFGVSGGTNKAYQSGVPQEIIETWMSEKGLI